MSFGVTRASRGCVVIVVAVFIAMAQSAAAQSQTELERGRSLFRQALSMEVAGDWAGALSRLENVARIKTTPQVRFHLARCKEHLGRLTEALGDYRLAEYEAVKLNLAELDEITAARQNLELRVPKIVVTLSPSLANCSVELDSIVLGAGGLGNAIPVNPGDHQLVVHTPDGQSFVRVVRAAESFTERVQLDPPPGFVRNPPGGPGYLQRTDSDGSSRPPAWAWIAGGVGATGIVTASVLWYVPERAIDDLNNGCQNGQCPTNLQSTQKRGETAAVVAPIALGAGLIGIGISAYGFLATPAKTATTERQSNKTVNVTFGCNSQYAGLNLAGAF